VWRDRASLGKQDVVTLRFRYPQHDLYRLARFADALPPMKEEPGMIWQ
jgi:hypothetical protein